MTVVPALSGVVIGCIFGMAIGVLIGLICGVKYMQTNMKKKSIDSSFVPNTEGQSAMEETSVIPVYEDIILTEIKDSIELSHNVAYGQVN